MEQMHFIHRYGDILDTRFVTDVETIINIWVEHTS